MRLSVSAFHRSLLLALIIVLVGCAAQAPPPGGPEDKIAPKVDTTTPRDRQLNVSPDARIYFKFDRDIDRASFQQAFSITPYLNGTVKYHWSGHNEVSVELPERLHDSTTYTVQLARDLKSRRGNNLVAPIRITYSTGPLIDTGSLSGYLLTPVSGPMVKASEIFIFAYDITIRNPDTLHFTQTPPDLLTQPDDKGVWQFLSMKVGHRYRVFAVGDVYRNHIYDLGVDAFGIPAGDPVLDSASKSNFYIRMSAALDTIPPELQDVEVVDSFHIRAHFSEAIDSNAVRANYFTFSGSPIIAAFRDVPDKKPGKITLLLSKPLTPNTDYSLNVLRDSIHDLAQNPVSDSARKATVTSPATIRAAVAPKWTGIGIRDSALEIPTMPAIPITFSDAVDHDSAARAITVTDTGGRLVPMRLQWSDDAHLYLKSTDSLMSNVLYTVRLRTGGFRSPVASMPPPAKDTVLRFRFRTANNRDFGKMSGDVAIADSFFVQNPKGALVVQAFQQGVGVVRQMILPHAERHYLFDQIPVGTYRVRAYLSRTGTAVYETGSVSPWQFSIPTGDYPKEVTTRPRWEMSKIDFEVH